MHDRLETQGSFDAPGAERLETSGSPVPRTLIVPWHWSPTRRACTSVLDRLFESAPAGVFRVVTPARHREHNGDGEVCALDRIVPARRISSWSWSSGSHAPAWTAPASAWSHARMVSALARAAVKTARSWNAQRVLAVYPHRCGLLAGWLAARRLGLPLVVYMHDLFAEALPFRRPPRRQFWRWADARILRDASTIIVPSEEFASHFGRRDVGPCSVLPHCTSWQLGNVALATTIQLSNHRDRLRLCYSGTIYEPHEDSVEAFIRATRNVADMQVEWNTCPRACGGLLETVGARWRSPEQARNSLNHADALLLFLGLRTPWPEEVHGCFPSKIIDYVCAGKPIFAIVPAGSFVDRLIRRSGCGLAVNSHEFERILQAVRLMHCRELRDRMADNANQLALNLRSDRWMPQLLRALTELSPARASVDTSVFQGCVPIDAQRLFVQHQDWRTVPQIPDVGRQSDTVTNPLSVPCAS